MKTLRHLVLAAVIIGSVLTAAPAAESFSVLLQKGIFAEETERNLDAAIKIYQQITTEAATNRPVVAQAQYRLGVCYQKKGSKEQAISTLNELLRQFPAEAALGQKARELLAELGQAPSNNLTIRQLPLAVDRVHSVSPNGRLLAYKPKDTNNVVIYEIPTGKTWTAVKDSVDQLEGLIFSPDARLIAYELSSSNAIYVAKTDGSETKQVCQFGKGTENWIYDWSPDGGQVVVGSWEEAKGTSLSTLDVKTGTLKEIKRYPPNTPYPGQVSFSSNGRYLACRAYSVKRPSKISLLDLESATETTLVEKEGGNLIGWFPGDAKILFSSARGGTVGLWAIAVREGKPSGEPELVRANIGNIAALRLTRDGSLYYTESKPSKDVYLATVDFRTGEVSGQARRVSDRFRGEQSMPTWSRDGQKLMFAVQVGQGRFVAVPMAAGEEKEYPVWETLVGAWLKQYAWSPDGAFLLVQAWRKEVGLGIHRYELASGATETLVTATNSQVPGNWVGQPRFAPDGKSFYYLWRDFTKGADGGTDCKDRIIRRNLRSGNEEIVYASPDLLYVWWPFELSPDGARLAVVASVKRGTNDLVALKVRGVSGGAETKEVVRMAPGEEVYYLAWTSDGQRLVYTKERAGKVEVWSTAVDSGQSVELNFSQPGIHDISIHPDGRQMAFCAGVSGRKEVWVMEGLLPKAVAPAAGEKKN